MDKVPQVRTHADSGNSGRNIAFYIETVCVVLLLFFVLTVVLQFFGSALVSTKQADREMRAAATARQTAELLQAADTPDQLAKLLGGEYDSDTGTVNTSVDFVAGEQMNVRVEITAEEHEAGTVYRALISTWAPDDAHDPFTMESARYVRGERP